MAPQRETACTGAGSNRSSSQSSQTGQTQIRGHLQRPVATGAARHKAVTHIIMLQVRADNACTILCTIYLSSLACEQQRLNAHVQFCYSESSVHFYGAVHFYHSDPDTMSWSVCAKGGRAGTTACQQAGPDHYR